MSFESYYYLVRPTVLRLYRTRYIKLWELSDWEQEGRLTLYQLLIKEPDLVNDLRRLQVYFKTKFTNSINDEIRKQESKKRRFNKMAYEEIGSVSHLLYQNSLDPCDYLSYRDKLREVTSSLTSSDQVLLSKVISGERFSGKKAFLKRLSKEFELFRDCL